MPTYEYKCKKCGHRFEKFQSIKAGPIRKCPECGKNAVERLISAGGGLIFKGSGFYITDYRDSAYQEKAKADTAAPEKSETKSDTKTGDAKPATETKSDTKTDSKTPAATDSKPAAESKPAKAEPKVAKSSSKKK
jgi:putative FmdB family regulatory protein